MAKAATPAAARRHDRPGTGSDAYRVMVPICYYAPPFGTTGFAFALGMKAAKARRFA
jgi:hypothetical protein